jgi:hypothetical protein
VTIDHAAAVEKLPWHHRDPFDRLLVAQALTEEAAIVSRDEPLSDYGVTRVCPRKCVGMNERDRHAIDKQNAEEQDR